MLSIAIIDSNRQELNITAEILKDVMRGNMEKEFRVDLYWNSFDFFDATGKGKFYDIYLLETKMTGGFSGIDIAQFLRKRGVAKPIIFVTSSKDYAWEAFGVDAMQYFMKPVTRDSIASILHKAEILLRNERRRQIVFKAVDGYYHVFIRDILYTSTNGKYQMVKIRDGRELRVRMTATEMGETLNLYHGFVRCGSSYTLNLYYIDHYDSKSAVMSDGTVFSIPRGAYSKLNTVYKERIHTL